MLVVLPGLSADFLSVEAFPEDAHATRTALHRHLDSEDMYAWEV